jgi:ribosomal-protein-alanine N-acetyltransferase
MIIKGRGFVLRHFKISDAKDLYESEQDLDSKRNFMSTFKSVNEAKKAIKRVIKEYSKSKPLEEKFVIEVNGKFAGNISIHSLNKKNKEHVCEVGGCTNKEYRNKGLATKSLKLITKYAFEKYKLKRIVGNCRTFNKASAKVLKKCGYKLEGILRKNKFKDGKYLDDMVWAKVK